MGNCSFRVGYAASEVLDHQHEGGKQKMIKVVTTTGGIMELYAPITADQITSEFPDHGLFLNPDATVSNPLFRRDHLHPGELYYLLPLSSSSTPAPTTRVTKLLSTPYRMSFDTPKIAYRKRSSTEQQHTDVVRRYNNGTGVWKVRLVINPEQLSEILSQEARTEELIESVRTVAKCGSTTTGSTSVAHSSNNSDHGSSSVSSCNVHWKA